MSLLSRRVLYPSLAVKPEIIYGKGSLGVLKNLPGDDYLVLTSNSFMKSESYTRLNEKILSNKKFNIEPIQNSYTKKIIEIKEKYLSWPPDIVIAIGGGSVLDSAKIIRHFLSFSEDNFETLAKRFSNSPPKIKLVNIPTTPNTGSEINNIAVVKKDTNEKIPFINKTFTPDLAVIDPVLLSTMPKNLMDDFISDIFAHAFEGSRSRLSNEALKNMALSSISGLKENLSKFEFDSSDFQAIENIQFSGQQAGTVAENAFVGIIHALAHSLESLTSASHGKCLHALMQQMLEWIKNKTENDNFNFDSFYNIWNDLDLNSSADDSLFNQVDSEQWITLALNDPAIKTDPIKFREDDLKELILWLQSTN